MKYGTIVSTLACLFFIGFYSMAFGSDIGNVLKGVADVLDAGTEETKQPAEEKAQGSSDDNLTSMGLKEALRVGITEAVKQVGVDGGFYKNAAIKILLPENFQKADAIVRQLGGDLLSDTLIQKMNQAAENAAPEALDIFVKAINNIKIDDAVKILSQKENGATRYLENKTADSLKETFFPVVKGTMEELNAVKAYNDYIGKFASSPLLKMMQLELDVNKYVADKAIDGLFHMVAAEENKIRENPAARVTDLLQDVFGKIGG